MQPHPEKIKISNHVIILCITYKQDMKNVCSDTKYFDFGIANNNIYNKIHIICIQKQNMFKFVEFIRGS